MPPILGGIKQAAHTRIEYCNFQQICPKNSVLFGLVMDNLAGGFKPIEKY